MDFFFYGTLIDDDIRLAVLQRRPRDLVVRRASVDGFRRVHRRGASYPILVTASAEQTEGVLVSGLDGRDRRRLLVFEGRDYALARVTAITDTGEPRAALAFLPRPGVPGARTRWHITDWRRRWKPRNLARLRACGRFAR